MKKKISDAAGGLILVGLGIFALGGIQLLFAAIPFIKVVVDLLELMPMWWRGVFFCVLGGVIAYAGSTLIDEEPVQPPFCQPRFQDRH